MGCRILAVEDSVTQAEALRALLEEQGNVVTIAGTAEMALEELRTSTFDLVLSDVLMPGITGFELCHRIKRDPTLSALPVVLLTSLQDPMDIVRGLECGADNYITKPYDPEHLLARVRHVLDNRRLRRDSKTSMGVTVRFLGRDLTITSDREQILDLFISSVEDVVRTNEALQRSQRELATAHERLEAYAREKDQEARASTDRYRALLQNAGDAIFVLDLEGRILELNPPATDLLGRAAGELLQRSLVDLVHPEERQELSAALTSLARGTPSRRGERKFLTPRGTEIWCEINASRTEVDGTTLVLLIVRDVTSRRKAEEALRESERQLREAQQIANIGSFEHYPATGEVAWSDQLYRIARHDPSQPVTFDDFMRLVHADDRELVLSAPAIAAKADRRFSIEFRLQRTDGTERLVQSVGAVELDRKGEVRRITGTVQDVTERKEAERSRLEREEAERANRAKSEFLSRMSHELRTPLNAILGFGQLLGMDDLTPEQRESVDQIVRGGRHLLQLINEVLDLARIEAGKLSLSLEPVPVGEVIRDAIDLLAPVADQRGITLAAPLDGAAGAHALADVQRLKQVVLNFLSNGIKYNRPGGRVTVEACDAPADRIRIAVRDTGAGLNPEQVQKLFAPFQRLGAEAGEIEGTGLGLIVAKALVEAMGGEIGVESQVGEGSVFWLELRRAEPSPPVPDASAAPVPDEAPREPSISAPGTILYIEDNPSNLRLVQRVLARPNLELLTASHASVGLDLARERRPDLILLDLNLPDMSGEQVLREIRIDPRLKSIPVVMLSADAMAGQAERLMDAGARDYITKPFDLQRFRGTVYRILEEERR